MIGYACIGLYAPINNWNIGGVFRAAQCYDARMIAIQGGKTTSIKAATDVLHAWKYIPVVRTNDLLSIIPYSCVPIAVEITDRAVSLTTFQHPDRAFYIFGPENGSLPGALMDKCYRTIHIPTKFCMNLAACANVVLYDRMSKRR